MATRGKTGERLSMQGGVHKAYKVLLKLINPKFVKKDKAIPLQVIKNAKGIAFITTIKAGFVWTGTAGTGIVIARLENGEWSGPASIGTGGMGWGLQIGASSTDSVLILNTTSAVKAFAGKGQVKFGGNLSVAAGPVGRDAEGTVNVGDGGVAAVYSYAHTRGAFAGLSLQGAVLFARDSDNAKFYGEKVSPTAILSGIVRPPSDNEDLNLLYKTLRVITNSETADFEYRDSLTGSMRDEFGAESFQASSSGPYEDHASGLGPTMGYAPGSSYAQPPVAQASTYDAYADRSVPAIAASYPAGYPAPAPAAPPPPAPSAGLPEGWREVKTDDGQTYYWNERESKTQWEKPVATPAIPPSPQPPLASYARPEPASSPYQQAAKATYSSGAPQQQQQQQAELAAALSSRLLMSPPGGAGSAANGLARTAANNPEAARSAANAAINVAAAHPDLARSAAGSAASSMGYNPQVARAAASAVSSNPDLARSAVSAAPSAPARAFEPAPQTAAVQADVARAISYRQAAPELAKRPPPVPLSTRPLSVQNFAAAPGAAVSGAAAAPGAATSGPAPSPQFTAEQVKAKAVPGMDLLRQEEYLTDAAFTQEFKMDRETFKALPKWKRDRMKKDAGLF